MRSGACSVQQALTPEAASVLKHSLTLARRRGHAQVTPLHVATTLLTSSSSSSSSFRDTPNLLRRACLKSHPHHPVSHPLQCRALELCFNVALNRLPTTPPPSSGPLTQYHPSLSNALIAALKRAQAHQRRGCIEQQQHQQLQQQQQQPLLAIKVELEQLIISILDDPSVSRVMREAGFSSTCVKNNLEEDSSSVSGSPSPSSFFFDSSHRDFISQGDFFPAHFFKPTCEQNPFAGFSHKEDLRVVLEVMLRKQGRRCNSVIVGDTVSSTERLVSEVMGRVERGVVPDELKSSQFVKFQLTYVHLRLMSRADVELKVSDLRRKMESLGGGGVIIYVGDLRWAVNEETKDGYGFNPVEHMVAEVGRLLDERRSFKVWLMATATYQTYMRCQMRQPSLESQWGLQAVVVPSGGLALSLQAPSGLDSRVTKLTQYPFQLLETQGFSLKEEQENFTCCAECTANCEKEASVVSLRPTEAKDINSSSSHLPSWMQPNRPDSHHKESLLELRKKWSRLCQNLHHKRRNQTYPYSPLFNQGIVGKDYHQCTSSHPWWPSSLTQNQNKVFMEPHSISFAGGPPNFTAQMRNGIGSCNENDVPKQQLSEMSMNSLNKTGNQEVKTTLALGSTLFCDSATSKDHQKEFIADEKELHRLLQENIPWQSEAIPSIMEALLDCRSSEKKGSWLLIRGNDRIAKRRLAQVTAEYFCGATSRFVLIDAKRSANKASSCGEILTAALTKDPKCVVLIENIDLAHSRLTELLAEGLKTGSFEDHIGRRVSLAHAIFILSTADTKFDDSDENSGNVIKMMLRSDDIMADGKRKSDWESLNEPKKPRRALDNDLDLNICVVDEEHDVPSDLTHETDGRGGLLESITSCITLIEINELATETFTAKLCQSFSEVSAGSGGDSGELCIHPAVIEQLISASGSFLDNMFERWLREVFQTSLATVKKGGKKKVWWLCAGGKMENRMETGFHGSSLPCRIHVIS